MANLKERALRTIGVIGVTGLGLLTPDRVVADKPVDDAALEELNNRLGISLTYPDDPKEGEFQVVQEDTQETKYSVEVGEDFPILSDSETRKEMVALVAGPVTSLGRQYLLAYEQYKPDPMGSVYRIRTDLLTVTEEGVLSQELVSLSRTAEADQGNAQRWERSPRAVYSPSQNVYWFVNWRQREEKKDRPRVEFSLIDSQGRITTNWVGENQATWKQGSPDIALSPDGVALIVWTEDHENSPADSWGQRFLPDGTLLDQIPFSIPGAKIQGVETPIVNSRVIYSPDADSFVVVGVYPFINYGGPSVYISGTSVPKEGGVKDLQSQLIDGRPTDKSVRLDLDILPSGKIAVVWEEGRPEGLGSLIQAQILSPTLRIDSPNNKGFPLILYQQKGLYFRLPQLITGEEGEVLAWEQFPPWQSHNSEGFVMPLDIEERRFGQPVKLTEKESSQRNIALTDEGRFGVWVDNRTGSPSEIRGAFISPQ